MTTAEDAKRRARVWRWVLAGAMVAYSVAATLFVAPGWRLGVVVLAGVVMVGCAVSASMWVGWVDGHRAAGRQCCPSCDGHSCDDIRPSP